MDKLEKILMPLIVTIGLAAMMLAQAEEGHIILLARVVGIFLGVVLSLAFVFRLLGMFLRYLEAKRILADTKAEIERLKTLVAEEEQTAQEQNPSPRPEQAP